MRTATTSLRAVLLIASVTFLARIVSRIPRDEESLAAGARTPEAAVAARELPAPLFGRAHPDVHSATDALQTRTGWAVLDGRTEQLVFLDDAGAFVTRTGRRGEGPGELIRASHIALLDTTVVVGESAGTRLDLFSERGAFLGRIPLDFPGCVSAGLRELVSGDAQVITMRLCSRAGGRTSVLLERVGATGEQIVLSERPFRDLRDRRLDPTRMPLMAMVGDRLYLGITPDPCVQEITATGDAGPGYCHPDPDPVMLPDSVREYLRRLTPRVEALGTSVILPDRYPPFEGILSVDGQLAFLTILDDDARALDVVHGDRLDRILLPKNARVFGGPRGLLLAREETEGTAFAVLPLP